MPPKNKKTPNKTKIKNNRVSKAANILSNKVEGIQYILFYFEIVKSKLQIILRFKIRHGHIIVSCPAYTIHIIQNKRETH